MKPVTMREAGDLVGASKSTIYRAVKSGKLSAVTRDGTLLIDPSELARVYPDFNPLAVNGEGSATARQTGDLSQPVSPRVTPDAGPDTNTGANNEETGVSGVSPRVSDTPASNSLRAKYITAVTMLKAQKQLNETLVDQVDDLRDRLDRSESERRQKDAQVTALLTDQSKRAPAPPPSIEDNRPGFWSRLFG